MLYRTCTTVASYFNEQYHYSLLFINKIKSQPNIHKKEKKIKRQKKEIKYLIFFYKITDTYIYKMALS